MSSVLAQNSGGLDDLDGRIIRALQIDPRASFNRVAAALGVSEQTVARRYRRLRGEGLLRVVGMVDPRQIGQSEWLVRVGCRPSGVRPLADALARRDDVSWVTLSAGGSEIVCSVRSRSRQQRDDLLLQRLPATSQVLSLTAHAILHRYVGGSSTDWVGHGDLLTPQEEAALRPVPDAPAGAGPELSPPGSPPPETLPPESLQPEDGPLLTELALDGRCSYAALAAAAGWTQGRVTRRLAALRRAGVLYFDIDLATELMGFAAPAYLWLTVEPASLAAAGDEVARHQEVPFAAAVSGSANLVASVVCRDIEALYRYVTTKISAVPGVRQLEISPILRRVKQAGTQMEGPRLARPVPPARARSRAATAS
jgi:DNA-binding Lrp family transcriptional regulator